MKESHSYRLPNIREDYETRISRHFTKALILLLGCIVLSLMTNIITDSWRSHDSIFYTGSLGILLSCYWLNKLKKYRISKLIFFLAVAAMLYLEAIFSGNIYMNSLCYIASMVLAFRFLSDIRDILFTASVQYIMLMAAILTISKSTYDFDPSLYDIPILQAIVFSLVFITLCIVMYVIHKEIQTIDEEKKLLISKLETKNIELLNAYDAVEHYALATSHDLKSPLVAINSFIKLIQRDLKKGKTEKVVEYMQYIECSGEKLTTLIEDLLQSSRLDTHKQNYNQEINVNTLVENISNDLKFIYPTATYNIGAMGHIKANESILRVVFQNLIDNGLKYNTSNQPIIEILRVDSDDNNYTFSVTDNGIGIGEADQQIIFELFSRADSMGPHEGYGVGLFNCKSIIDKHLNGTISVKSNVGQGTTFTVTIPQ